MCSAQGIQSCIPLLVTSDEPSRSATALQSSCLKPAQEARFRPRLVVVFRQANVKEKRADIRFVSTKAQRAATPTETTGFACIDTDSLQKSHLGFQSTTGRESKQHRRALWPQLYGKTAAHLGSQFLQTDPKRIFETCGSAHPTARFDNTLKQHVLSKK